MMIKSTADNRNKADLDDDDDDDNAYDDDDEEEGEEEEGVYDEVARIRGKSS